MLKKILHFLCFVCVCFFAESPEVRGNAPAKLSGIAAHADGDRIKRLAVYLKHESPISGRFVAIEGDTLILHVSGALRKISKDNILSVLSLDADPPVGQYALYCAGLAMFVGNYLVFEAEGQPTRFIHRSSNNIWANALFAFVGSGFAVFTIRSNSKPREIDFGFEDEVKSQEAWDKLKSDLLDLPGRKVLHLSIQAGHVYSRNTGGLANSLVESGFRVSYSGRLEPARQFNLIRRIQLTYSIASSYEIGIAAYFLGEPGTNFYSLESTSVSASQSVDANGVYLLGAYRPGVFGSQSRHVWKVGLGIGIAKREYGLDGTVCDQGECTVIADGFSDSGASATLFTEFDLMLTNSISINISGDYAWVPGRKIAENQALGLPVFELKAGNGSIGIGLGMHF